ncbi:[protein-PII] uridylyltransferase [Sulfurivirga sp.]|uniref:[protein-PII] uridylyltransferase n=1 Tax=Sulfurivirga sp. TaxID=2614236 RepID=UPI0025CD8408|nr:[protein-PII] uridylyltransferase [Sulfurivirga sp.]
MKLTDALRSGDLNTLRATGREILTHFRDTQFAQFDEGRPAAHLVCDRANFIDQLLKLLWQHFGLEEMTLVAVGGYGRGELHPYSDIDLLIIADEQQQQRHEERLSTFLTLLWDWGLDVGSSVRSTDACREESLKDVTIATNLLESRWLAGDYEGFGSLRHLWKDPEFWPPALFYEAKYAEQQARREKVQGTLYQMEPNLKECPGGLRDIQTIFWIARRLLNADSLYSLLQHNLLTPQEFNRLQAANKQLSRFRFALHRYKKRREDRLLFENQQLLADALDYPGETVNQQVEALMHTFYSTTRTVIRLNEVLLAHFREQLFDQSHTPVPINDRFQVVNDFLEVRDPAIYERNPTALLETFLLFTYHPQLKGLRAGTLRAIDSALHVIDDAFREDAIHKTLLLALFRQPQGVYHSLKHMHQYGVLEHLIPQFGQVTGLMQFNMFHAYPVDEHTLLVIRNLRRFFIDQHAWEFPTAHQVARRIEKPELLFLSGLFHDITKGNEPHAETGAVFAESWCAAHNLSPQDTALVTWLVRHHLIFSDTAQRQDLSDPEVIARFAEQVGDQKHLDYLYLLTVADVLSTSPEVWNDWKNALFLELYNETSRMLDKVSETPRDIARKALRNQEKARELLTKQGLDSQRFSPLWDALADTEFFHRQGPQAIARITTTLVEQTPPVVKLSEQPVRGATEILIYMPDRDFLFAQIAQTLERAQVSIMEAQIYCLSNGYTLTLFYALDKQRNAPLEDTQREAIRAALLEVAAHPIEAEALRTGRPDRKLRCFITPTEITFQQRGQLTELFISTLDVPGLLARIARVFVENRLRLHDARISTVGEKAEDVFLLSDREGAPLDEARQHQLRQQLMEALSCE